MIKTTQRGLNRYFYFCMSLLICVVVGVGFGPHLGERLLHPPAPVPVILYWHAIVFTAWVALFVTQTALVGTSNTKLHRRLGPIGGSVGAILPILGIATAFEVQIWRGVGDDADIASLSVPFNDMLTFAIAFWLAMYRRRAVDWHRRLMFIATCSLTVAAFARFPGDFAPFPWMYAYVDLLIVLGALRDITVERCIHPAYQFGLPLVILGQTCAVWLASSAPPMWTAAMRFLLQQHTAPQLLN